MPVPARRTAVALKRIGIEIVRAVAAEAGERAVEQRELENVGVAAVEVEMQHALRPEDQRHRGAGLGIRGLVRQVVVDGEAFVMRRGTKSGGHIHLGVHHVGPQRLAGFLQRRVVELGGEVGHRGVQVHGAHGMADDLALLAYRDVRLGVLVIALYVALRLPALLLTFLALDVEIVRLPAALVDEVGGEVEMLLLAGQVVELDESEFDFLVTVIAALLSRAGAED